MPNQAETALAAIEEIISRFAPKRPDRAPVTVEMRLMEDLGIDSPRMIDIVLEVEDRFGICVEDADAQKTRTVGDLLDLVEARGSK